MGRNTRCTCNRPSSGRSLTWYRDLCPPLPSANLGIENPLTRRYNNTGTQNNSALSKFGVIYVMTHDSIGLGEDGPTHQPVEVMELMRATPNMMAFRPADGNEVRYDRSMYLCI